MQSMKASRTVTTPATVQCLDLKDLDVVDARATHINRQVQVVKNVAWKLDRRSQRA